MCNICQLNFIFLFVKKRNNYFINNIDKAKKWCYNSINHGARCYQTIPLHGKFL